MGYGRELRNFIECIREKWTPESDLELALDVTLAIYAGYVSAAVSRRCVQVHSPGYNSGYTETVKTAVSMPDDLFRLAEAAARRLRVSRSELYARAIAEYLKQRQGNAITERLNEV